jgi:hypothetical protein
MIDLRITTSDLATLREHVLGHTNEHCAVLLASSLSKARKALIVREMVFPVESDYADQSPASAELKPEFVARVTKRAKIAGLALVFVHTHPGELAPQFSRTDDEGERKLAQFLASRGLQQSHAAMVLSDGGICARTLGAFTPMRVVSIGEKLIVEFDPSRAADAPVALFDRQIRAFGTDGQRILQSLRVGIVGLGGTGSIMAQQLAHMGVRDFVLIDPDHLELTNLNRVVGVNESDIGKPKVELSERHILTISTQAVVQSLQGDVVRTAVAEELLSVDIIIGCTDSHGSRSVLQQIAYQYLIPCIDIGSTITTKDGLVSGVFGRVQLLSAGQACLWCS